MFAPNTKFLVVDDFATMRKIIKKVLFELGYKNVEEADDGSTALVKLETALKTDSPFQVVISDWNMPQMSGLSLLKRVRIHKYMKSIPFVLVTAENEQKQIVEAVKAGVSDYLMKPFNAATFKEKLEKVSDKHATAA